MIRTAAGGENDGKNVRKNGRGNGRAETLWTRPFIPLTGGYRSDHREENRMLTRDRIKKMAGYSYARGVEIFNHNEIAVFHAEETEGGTKIRARVKGSGRHVYAVEIALSREGDEIGECHCECPAFYSYEGLCKHCVAVLLEYLSRQKNTADRDLMRRAAGAPDEIGGQTAAQPKGVRPDRTAGVPARARQKQTTPALKELLQKQTVCQTLPVLQSATYGQVRLEPILTCTRDECQVEFRIGVKKMYVLKDVFQFASSMQFREDYAYGKGLQFVHTPDSFTEQSRPMAAFLVKWVERYAAKYQQFMRYSYFYPGYLSKQRSIRLDGWELDAFLDAAGDAPFTANVDGTGEKQWRVVPETLRRQVFLTGTPDGMKVRLDGAFGYVGDRSYVFFRDQKICRVPREELRAAEDFLECMRTLPGRSAFVQKADLPVFFRQIVPALRQCMDCVLENIDEDAVRPQQAVFRFYLDMPQEDLVTCRAEAVYGEREYSVFSQRDGMGLRDFQREAAVAGLVGSWCNAYDEAGQMMVIHEDDALLYALLTDGVARLQQLGEVYISDALKRIRLIRQPRISVGLSLSGDLLNLSISSEDISREQLAEILSRYERRRKYYRLRDGSILCAEEEELGPLADLRGSLQLTERQLRKEEIGLPRYRALYLEEELKDSGGFSVYRDRDFRALVGRMKSVEDNAFAVPESLEGVLREYQKYGYRWIRTLYHNGFGGILADDMGLGKTLQVICFLLSETEDGGTKQESAGTAPGTDGPFGSGAAVRETEGADREACRRTLIVCPASLVYNWKKEIERFAPQLSARMVVGTAPEREVVLKEAGQRDILITSYDLLRRDAERYEKMDFFCQVIDEAQYIKNHGTLSARAVKQIRAGFRLALTGTPVENRLSELWSIFDYLMPGYLYSYQRFREELESPIVAKDDEACAARLQKMIRPFVLRRLKKDVLKELPDKLEENVYAQMEGEQQQLYDAHVKRMQLMLDKASDEEFKNSRIQILAELTKLRQLCCDPALLYEGYRGGSAKKELAVHLVKNAVANGHKVLLFSQFTSMLDRLAASLRAERIPFYMLTGATPKEKRAQMVEDFAEDAVPVFCISLKAGGTGLNLTAADVVIHFDPWWNVAVQNQATDRAHRIGQRNTVNVYRLIARGTVEEKIVDLQARKLELADRILGGEGVGAGSLTREELMELLR